MKKKTTLKNFEITVKLPDMFYTEDQPIHDISILLTQIKQHEQNIMDSTTEVLTHQSEILREDKFIAETHQAISELNGKIQKILKENMIIK